jgi:putative tricarboxylic transport membrane protein
VTVAQRGGLIASVVLAVLGVAAVVGGIGYGVTVEGGEIGPGFLPAFSGGLVALFALLDLVGRLRRRTDLPTQAELILDTVEPIRTGHGGVIGHTPGDPGAVSTGTEAFHVPDTGDDLDIFGRTQKQRNRMLAVVLGLIVAALIAVQLVGFLIAFVLLIFVIAVVVEGRKVVPAAIVSVAAGAVTYAIFVALLRVPLPQGLLGII